MAEKQVTATKRYTLKRAEVKKYTQLLKKCTVAALKKHLKSHTCRLQRQSRSSRSPIPYWEAQTAQKRFQIALKDPELHQFKNEILLCESR